MRKYCLFILLFLSCTAGKSNLFQLRGSTMGTYYMVKTDHRVELPALKTAIEKELNQLEINLSDYTREGDVYGINRQAGESYFKVSPSTYEVISLAVDIARGSGGAFDPTVRPLLEIWGFKTRKFKVPEQTVISAALVSVDWKSIMLKNGAVKLARRGMRLDLGGIAKGYSADKIAALLRKRGIENAIVEIGGDLYCLGKGPDSAGWRIGIRNPFNQNNLIGEVTVADKAVATSGEYENFFQSGSRKYGHIIDPRNGYPANNGMVSVTVVADNCALADGWATALFVLGLKKAKQIVESAQNMDAVLIYRENGVSKHWISQGIINDTEYFKQ